MFLLNKILATIPRLLHIGESTGGKECALDLHRPLLIFST